MGEVESASSSEKEVVAHLWLGRRGEGLACQYLWRKGFRILQRNYVSPYGEIDIIAEKRECVHFVEVKTRSSERLGAPEERVDAKKQRNLEATALAYLDAFRDGPPGGTQFDVLAVVLKENGKVREINLYENAF